MYYKQYIVMLIGLSILLNPTESSCNSTAVRLYDGQAALAGAGNYFLSQDVAGPVTISGSNITLNLNGHQIGGLTIGSNSDLSNIRVSNGIISDTVSIGTLLGPDTNNVHLTDLVVHNATGNGIDILSASEVFISRVLVTGAAGDGISTGNFNRRIFITDSAFTACGRRGIDIRTGAAEVIVRDTQSYNNMENGAFVTPTAQRIYFIRFIASENSLDGINGTVNPEALDTNFACIDCIFENNGRDGINPTRTRFILKGCVAENNGQDGFTSDRALEGIMTQCVALNNVRNGLQDNDGGLTNCRYTNNYAYNNTGGNYDPSGDVAPFRVLEYNNDSAQYWRNIDGTSI